MYQTVEDLEYQMLKTQRSVFRKVFSEMKVFVIIFVMVFCFSYLITNAQLLKDSFNDTFQDSKKENIIETLKVQVVEEKRELKKETNTKNLIAQYEWIVSKEKEPAENIEKYLMSNLHIYDFDFNTLPPTNRIISDKINLDAPVVKSEVKDWVWNGKFDKDLENGVVKYPESANPWEKWTVFLFGHTSQEYWEKNPYGTVFRNIPKLVWWDIIQIVWEWNQYEYAVLETIIVSPSKVNETYLQYARKDGEYLVLMWCYPIGRTDKRMMVFAQRIW